MNTKLTIKNFRVFDEDGVTVDLKPITVLTGCNSSGKSSVVKAALMLNEFWKQQKDKLHTHDVKIDFTSYPINLMGRMDKVLHRDSDSNTLFLEYAIYSPLISQELTVKLQFAEKDKDQLGNAHLQDIAICIGEDILLKQKVVYNSIVKKNIYLSYIDLNLVKKQFFEFLSFGNIFSQISHLYDLREGMLMDEQGNFLQISEEEYTKSLEELKTFFHNYQCENENRIEEIKKSTFFENHYKKLNHNLFKNDSFTDLAEIIERAQKTGSLFYIPLMDTIGKMNKEELRSFIDANDLATDRNKSIIEDFIKSEYDTFGNFFESKANNYFSSYPFNRQDDGFYTEPIYYVVMDWNEKMCPGKSIYYSKQDVFFSFEKAYIHKLEQYLYAFAFSVVEECLNPAFSSISYVSSSRATIKRLYTLETKDDFSVLLKKCLESGNIKPEESFINKWVKKFGIGDSITFHSDSEGLGVQIRLHKTPEDKDGRLLADEGYGITQLLSIMLQIEMSGKSETTIAVEEPEIHLHPKYQSLLADMFVDAYKTLGQHFIIETHSEYLIRRLQLLVAGIDTEKKLDKNDVSIAYIYTKEEAEKENQPRVKNIAICDDGYLDDTFGSGFFDEAISLSRKLM